MYLEVFILILALDRNRQRARVLAATTLTRSHDEIALAPMPQLVLGLLARFARVEEPIFKFHLFVRPGQGH